MQQIIAIAAGGAGGAVMRFLVSGWIYAWFGRSFPYGTLGVNVIGSFLMGFLFIALIERFNVGPEWRAVLLVGFLGAFTTFSTFSLETLNLIEDGEMLKAMLNIIVSVIACIAAAAVGMYLGRQL